MNGVTESKLTLNQRKNLPDDAFGLPKERKFPLIDKTHVLSAIRYFDKCDEKDRKELANNIIKKIKEYKMDLNINKSNPFYKYYIVIQESCMPEFIYESKLTSKERKELPDNAFGLPKERKFPLIDKRHVQAAIQYFKFCPKESKTELATNINKKLKEFDMEIKLNKNNPFYKYANKTFVTEAWDSAKGYTKEMKTNHDSLRDFIIDHTEMAKNKITTSDIFFTSLDDFIEYRLYGDCIDVVLSTPFKLIIERTKLLINKIRRGESIVATEVQFLCMDYCGITLALRDVCSHHILNEIESAITIAKCDVHDYSFIKDIITSKEYPEFSPCVLDDYVEDALNDNIDMIKNKLNNADMLKSGRRLFDPNHTLDTIRGNLNEFIENFDHYILKKYNKNYSTMLNDKDLFHLNKIPEFKNNTTIFDSHGWFTFAEVEKDMVVDLYIIIKEEIPNTNSIVLIKLIDNGNLTDEYITLTRGAKILDRPLKRKKYTFNSSDTDIFSFDDLSESVFENLSIDTDGNIIFKYSPKRKYMDDYSECNKILVQNFKNKNYEAMKTNLAFLFMLVHEIERKYGKDKPKDDRYEDAMKARMFAINDFKRYLKEVQMYDPKFDFVKYYKNHDYDKLIFKTNTQTINEISKMFVRIMRFAVTGVWS